MTQDLSELQKNWNLFGEIDPLWAISTLKEKMGGKWELEDFFLTGMKEMDRIVEHVNLLEIKLEYSRALDFGCGVGRLTQAMAKYFKFVDGVDIAPSMIDLAKKYNQFNGSVNYYLNDKNNLAFFNQNSYDFIYSNDVFQHMSPKIMEDYLIELLRILSPTGVLIFQLPSEYLKKIDKLKSFLGINQYLINFYGKISHKPVMQYYLTPKETIETFVLKNNAKIVDAFLDSRKNVISYIYFVQKNSVHRQQ